MTATQTFRNTIIILLTLLSAYVIVISAEIVIVLLMAIIIASALRPLVTGLTKQRVPMSAAILVVYTTLAIIVLLLGLVVIPPIANQITDYIENDWRLAWRIIRAQRWVEGIISDVTNHDDVSLVAPDEIREAVSQFVTQIRAALPSMLNDIGTTLGQAVLIVVMGAYWLTSHEKATEYIKQLSPIRYRDNVQQVIDEVEDTMGSYVRGMITISAIVGLLNFTAMQIAGIPNALTLAFIIAITTIIPMIGGLIGGVLVVLITLVASPEYILGVIAITFIVQQIEAYYLGPRIMSDRVGLDPLLVILYTSVGFVMFGIVGALIAVPIMGTVHILLLYLVIEPYREKFNPLETEDGLPVIKADEDKEAPLIVIPNET